MSESFNPIRIYILKNGDEHQYGRKFIVTHKIYRNFEQFLSDVSKKIGLEGGAARRLYTVNGSEILGLKELQDAQFYVATAGEAFTQCKYHLELRPPSTAEEKSILTSSPNEKGTFQADSKGIRVYAYIEGNCVDPPKRVVLNFRNSKTWDLALSHLSQELKANEGSIKRIFDVKSQSQIMSLDDFYDGINIIAIANPKLAKPREGFQYQIYTNEKSNNIDDMATSKAKEVLRIKEQKQNVKKENAFEMGGKGIRIFAYISGFDKQKPRSILLNWRNCKNMDQFYNLLSAALKPSEGPVRSAFLLDLKTEIKDISTLSDGSTIVCVATTLEKIPKSGNYEPFSIQNFSRPSTANKPTKNITVYPNGDANHTGIKVPVSEFRFKTIDKLFELLDQQLKLHLGKVTVLYEFEAKQLDSADQLNNNTPLKASNVKKVSTIQEILESDVSYFVAGTNSEPFRSISYNTNGIQTAIKSSFIK